MTREVEDSTVHYSKFVWYMRCDKCGFKDPNRYPRTQPRLEDFRDKGWFIAKHHGDCCPVCVSDGKATAEPYEFKADTAGVDA